MDRSASEATGLATPGSDGLRRRVNTVGGARVSLADYTQVPAVYRKPSSKRAPSAFEEVAGTVVTAGAASGSDTSSLLENFQAALHGEVLTMLHTACAKEGDPRTLALEDLFFSLCCPIEEDVMLRLRSAAGAASLPQTYHALLAQYYATCYSEVVQTLLPLCGQLWSHPLFPSIFALLFNLWLLGTFQPVGQQEGFQAVHVAALTSGVTRLFWSDVQTNGFEFQHLFAFLARQVGHPTHLDAVPPTLHAELVAVVMRFMLYYNQAADLATFLRQLPLRSIVSTREMAEAAGVPWLMPSGAGAEQGSSMAGAAPSTPSSSPLPPVTDSSVMRAGRFDARWGGGEATLTQAPSLSSLVGEVDAALTPGVTAAGRIPSGGLDDMELPDGWAERGGGSPGGRTATPLILDSDDEDGGTGGGGPTPTTPTLLAARPTPALDFEDALPPLPASASSMSDSGEEGCGGGAVPRTPAAPRTAAALTVASAARQELQGSPGSVEEGVGGEGVGSELLATLPTPDMPSTGGVFGEPARTFSPVSPAALRLKAAALVKCVLTMVRGIRHEASLVHCITAMRVFAEPSFQALLCPEAQARLRSGLQAFTSPGGPLFPTRAVRSMERRVLDAVFPQGVTTRRLVSLAFRMLSPYYAVESAQAFVWEGCVAAASGCGCSRRSVAQAARQAAEATGVPLPTPVSKDVQMQRRSEPLPATVLEALAMSVNFMACLCCCRSRGSAVARGGK